MYSPMLVACIFPRSPCREDVVVYTAKEVILVVKPPIIYVNVARSVHGYSTYWNKQQQKRFTITKHICNVQGPIIVYLLRNKANINLPHTCNICISKYTQNHTEPKAALRCPYNYLTSLARLPQNGHEKFARLLQDKGTHCTVPSLQLCHHYYAIFCCSRTFHSILTTALQ